MPSFIVFIINIFFAFPLPFFVRLSMCNHTN